MNNKFVGLFKSRKFWAAAIGLGFVFVDALAPNFPLDATQVTVVVYTLIAYIVGTAIEDGGRSS